jgi:hypothetical protein
MTRSKIDADGITQRILYPRREAAFQLGLSVRTLDEYAKLGEIHPRFIGGKVLYHRSELERFARANHASPFTSTISAPARLAPQSVPAERPLQMIEVA